MPFHELEWQAVPSVVPQPNWKHNLLGAADDAADGMARLAELAPAHEQPMEAAIATLHGLLGEEARERDDITRGRVAALAGYIMEAGAWLREQHSPIHEEELHCAARDIHEAALEILLRMDGDYGVYPPEVD